MSKDEVVIVPSAKKEFMGDILRVLGAFSFCLVVMAQPSAFAWGKRGHEITAAVAARILEERFGKTFLRSHEFDLGYYTNVPDIIWRGLPDGIDKIEAPQHYLDWTEALEKAFGKPENIPVSFSAYKEKLGDKYNFKLGVVPWRIHDLAEECAKRAVGVTREKQGPLIVCLGLLSHYTGDLSMPLHTTDNYDGQFSGQKGVHTYFEGELVNALDPELKTEVLNRALKDYDSSPFGGAAGNQNADQLLRLMIADSHSKIKELLDLDKKTDRKNITLAKEKFHGLIAQRLVVGAIMTAKIWKDIIKDVNSFDENKFYFFDGSPKFIEPRRETH